MLSDIFIGLALLIFIIWYDNGVCESMLITWKRRKKVIKGTFLLTRIWSNIQQIYKVSLNELIFLMPWDSSHLPPMVTGGF